METVNKNIAENKKKLLAIFTKIYNVKATDYDNYNDLLKEFTENVEKLRHNQWAHGIFEKIGK